MRAPPHPGYNVVEGNSVNEGTGAAKTETVPLTVGENVILPDAAIATDCPLPTLILLAGACCFKSLLKKSTQLMSYGPSTAVTSYQIFSVSAWSDAATLSISICAL